MESWLRELDFESTVTGTIKDLDYTRKIARDIRHVVNDRDFENMDSEMIYRYLQNGIRLISFPDYLKRYIYEKAEMDVPLAQVDDRIWQEIIRASFEDTGTPRSFHETSKRWSAVVKGWLTQESVKRETVFLLGFGLRMTPADVSDFLTKVLREPDFNLEDPRETICWFCYANGFGFQKYEDLWNWYEAAEPGEASVGESARKLLTRSDFYLEREPHLRIYLRKLKITDRIPGKRNRDVFLGLYDRVREVIAGIYQADADEKKENRRWTKEDIMPGDLEKMLCSGIPVNEKGNLEKAARSQLARHFGQKRMSRQHIDGILGQDLEVGRFDIITLEFFLFAQRDDLEYEMERLQLFFEETNRNLKKCHMAELYPANPYEAFVIMCLVTECPLTVYGDVWEMSY